MSFDIKTGIKAAEEAYNKAINETLDTRRSSDDPDLEPPKKRGLLSSVLKQQGVIYSI
jgi:hypothetical protein